MTLTEDSKRRLAQGEAAAPGAYIDLLDEVDDVDELFQAYMSLRDKKIPAAQQTPLTTATLKHYVRLVHDAIRSTDEAQDAFSKDDNGNVIPNKKTAVMKYLDDVRMYEVQLIAARTIKTVHKVHNGTLMIPSWPALNGLKLCKYKTFDERMAKLIQSLKLWKSICKALFFDQVPMEVRLALQPEAEAKKKGSNSALNSNRDVQLKFAKKHMPKDDKPATPGAEDDAEDDNEDDHEDEDEAEEADDELTPARGTKRPRVAISLTSGPRRGKISTPSRSTQPADSTGGPIQPSTPTASAPAFKPTSGSGQPSSGIAFVPINAGGPSQPATPASVSDDGQEQANLFAGPPFLDYGALAQGAFFTEPMGKDKLCETSKPTLAHSGNQGPQMAGSYINEWPPAYSPGQYIPAQQFQSPSLYYTPQPRTPGSQVAPQQASSHGFHQSGSPTLSVPQANQQPQKQESQGNFAQSPLRHQIPQHNEITGINHGLGNIHHGETSSHQHKGKQAFQTQKDVQMNSNPNWHMAGVQSGTRLNSPDYVVNHYYPLHAPGSLPGQVIPFGQDPNYGYMAYEQVVEQYQDLFDDDVNQEQEYENFQYGA